MLGKRFLHLIQELQHTLHSYDEMLRAGAFLDHGTPALAFEDVWNSFKHRFFELGALEILMTNGDPETADRGAGIMNILIQLLGPQPHLRPLAWLIRPQPLLRKDILQGLE